jgi:hypothetical protein
LFAPSIAVTSHVREHRFQLGQPLLGQSEAAVQFCPRLDRSRQWIDSLGAVNVGTTVSFTASEEPTRDCASEYRLALPCQPRCLLQ